MINKNEPLVSIIVPVYNVEKYIKKCLDSLITQTYSNLDIIVVNDGSTDNSAEICREYSSCDERVNVVNKENGGLSSARNYGLDYVKGEWLMFVDSDDYIDNDMVFSLINKALEMNCDVVECGIYDVFPNETVMRKMSECEEVFEGMDIMRAHLVDEKIENAVWNKLYRAILYSDIRFVEGRNYEDIEITHRVLRKAEKVAVIPQCYYYYIQREGSISKTYELTPLVDYWKGCYEKFREYSNLGDDYKSALMKPCVHSSGTVWLWMKKNTKNRRTKYKNEISKMSEFINDNYNYIKTLELPIKYRMMAFFVRYNNTLSFSTIFVVGSLHRLFSKSSFYK